MDKQLHPHNIVGYNSSFSGGLVNPLFQLEHEWVIKSDKNNGRD